MIIVLLGDQLADWFLPVTVIAKMDQQFGYKAE